MWHCTRHAKAALLVGWMAFGWPALGQQFVQNPADIPSGNLENGGEQEQVDYADVDLDGDWDAGFAKGGANGNEQNRLWINSGGAQGGSLGIFVDETDARFPNILDTSRDLEFVDFDSDGDSDVYVSNDSGLTPQTSRFWVNLGGPDGGKLGYFEDQSAARWVGLGGPGSSVAHPLLLASGGFVDWSDDADFADFDNDGDLDLIHSSHGPSYGGTVPTRIFLNDGAGFFEEFNPSGFQLASTAIQNGNPGLWCEGVQQHDTANTSGAQCDIALVVVDLDLGDVDGDLDLDVLLGSRTGFPRFFTNRLEETGALAFRDTSHATFPPNWTTGGFAYEQELGDLDGDGDLDIYGLNWSGFNDSTLENTGGAFAAPLAIAGTAHDAEEADFIDFDADGDLDVFIANFSGNDYLVENTGAGFVALAGFPGSTETSHDADVGDLDQDGDYDVMVANGNNAGATYFENQTPGAADVSAPYLAHLEAVAGGPAGSAPKVVRVQVYDNAPDYITAYQPTQLEVQVDGGPSIFYPMCWSGAQVFRGEISGQLVGSVSYRAVSTDEHGNTGASAFESYVASAGACDSAIATYCTAKPNTLGCLPSVSLSSCVSLSDPSPSVALASLFRNNKNGLFFYGLAPAAIAFQGGTLCILPPAAPHVAHELGRQRRPRERLLGRLRLRPERLGAERQRSAAHARQHDLWPVLGPRPRRELRHEPERRVRGHDRALSSMPLG